MAGTELAYRKVGGREIEKVDDQNPLPVLTPGGDAVANLTVVEERYSYYHIAAGAAATYNIKRGAGFLHCITFGTKATASNVTTVYDDPSGAGTVIGVFDGPNVPAGTTSFFDCVLKEGLTIITSAANGGDVTVCYR